jgi:hypothetical protein
MILEGLRDFKPPVVTLWGVGLTDSDLDLLEIYRMATHGAGRIEFINPTREAFERAQRLLERSAEHYSSLDAWLLARSGPSG